MNEQEIKVIAEFLSCYDLWSDFRDFCLCNGNELEETVYEKWRSKNDPSIQIRRPCSVGHQPFTFCLYGREQNRPLTWSWIRADNDLPYFAPFGELKPVPHPDTVRLDWLAKMTAP